MNRLIVTSLILIGILLVVGCENPLGGNGNGDDGDGDDTEQPDNGADGGNGGDDGGSDGWDGATVEEPVFSLESGQYVGEQSVEITSATPQTTIYYRLDYETATESDTVYNGPITVDSTVHVTAVAVREGVVSESRTELYAIREAGYTNEIANGDFSEGTGGWFLWVEPDTSASAGWTTEDADGDGDEELAIEIRNGGSESYHVQANAPLGFASNEGELYELTFTAWAETSGSGDFGPLTIRVDDGRDDVDGDGEVFEAYFYQHEVIPTTPKTFTKRIAFYVSPDHEHPQTRLAFDLGSEGNATQQGTIYLDDVSVQLVESPESFDTVVTSAAMRAALMPSIQEQEDRDGEARRFEGVTEAEVTAYHLAALEDIYLDDDSFEDAGYTLEDFDLSAMDLSYFGALDDPDFDEAPITDDDIVTLAGLTQLRQFNITAGDATDIAPLASLRRLEDLGLNRNAVSVSAMDSLITPATFPDLRQLELDFAEVSLEEEDVDTIVSIFTAFGDSGTGFREIEISNAGLSDSDFATLYDDLLQSSSQDLRELTLGGWTTTGSLTGESLDKIGTLSGLKELKLIGQAFTTLDGISTLSGLEELDVANNPDLVDFSALSSLTELLELDLGHTGFEDEADGQAIADLTSLEVLNLRGASLIAPRGENGSVTGEEMDGLVTYFEDADLDLFSDGGTLELGTMSTAYYDANSDSLEALEATGLDVEYRVSD